MDNELDFLISYDLWEEIGCLLNSLSSGEHMRAVDRACQTASDPDILDHVVNNCAYNQINYLQSSLVRFSRWSVVSKLLEKHGFDHDWLIEEAVDKAKQETIVSDILPHCCYDLLSTVMEKLVKRKLYSAVVSVLERLVKETLNRWYTEDANSDTTFWNILASHHTVDLPEMQQLIQAPKPSESKYGFWETTTADTSICEAIFRSTLIIVIDGCFSCGTKSARFPNEEETAKLLANQIFHEIICKIRDIHCYDQEEIRDCFRKFHKSCIMLMHKTNSLYTTSPFFQLYFIKSFLSKSCSVNTDNTKIDALLLAMCLNPLLPSVHSVTIRVMLHDKRWEAIEFACMPYVWETFRRELFKGAMEQQQWSLVKQLADHTLCDDLRIAAIRKALKEHEWEVCLALADFGLKESEMARIHYNVSKHADPPTILQMLKKGVDVTEMKERLQKCSSRRRANEEEAPKEGQLSLLCSLEQSLSMRKKQNSPGFPDWTVAFFHIVHDSKDFVRAFLKKAIKRKEWPVVMHLARLALNTKQRNSLFPKMVSCKQWAVCRMLLDHGVDVDLCLASLPTFVQFNQWMLVARVVEYNIGDDKRKKIMSLAMKQKEGSVVWQSIYNMKKYIISLEEREGLFQQAASHEVWQALKGLIEIKDTTGRKHRDAVTLAAVKQHQWDVVDHCERCYANIHVPDKKGMAPIQTEARKQDWKAVEELACRDGDASELDIDGYTVLHRAIKAKAWDTVKMLIQYQADIHKPACAKTRYGVDKRTPLQMLIDYNQGDLIELSLMWCPDQDKGVNDEGKTVLHVACLSGQPSALYYLIRRGADPLAVTKSGESVLLTAVQNKTQPRKMVAECIRLGLSTHQPLLNEDNETPFECALIKGMLAVAKMLYESGSCSNKELFNLHSEHMFFEQMPSEGKQYLEEVAFTPRSLQSSCRLVISHYLGVRGRRHLTVSQLPLGHLKKYIMFDELSGDDDSFSVGESH